MKKENNEKTLQEILKENKERRRKFIQQEIKREHKEKIIETVLTLFVGIFIIAITFILLNDLSKNEINDCISIGYSQTYCERGLK